MHNPTSSLYAHRAAAFILLFVLVSQCPYSPYGAPVIRRPHSPQGQSALNAIEKQVERSSGVNTTNITPFEEIFRHPDAHDQQLEQVPSSTQNFQQRLSTAPPSANTVALQTTEQKSSLTSPKGSSSNQTTPQTDRLARFRSPDSDYPQRYPEAQRQRISRSNRKRVSNQLQPEYFFHQAFGYIDYINYQLDSQLPAPEKSSSSNYTVSTSSGSTTSISSTTNESYTYNPIIKIFLLVAVLILQVLLLCNSTTTSAEYSKFNNSIELKETFTSFYQQVNQIMRTAKSIQIIASAASDVTIKARIDYDLPHVTFANSSSLSIEAIDTLHPSSYGGSDYSNLGISIINNKIPASSVCSASYYEVLRQRLSGLNLSYDD